MPYICQMNKDLNFIPHGTVKGGVQCKIKTDNGYTISIVGGPGLYGDGVNTFEVACWKTDGDNAWVKLSPQNDVVGNRTKDDVMTIISDIESGVLKQYV